MTVNNQTKYKYKIGEKVFAKVRGYPSWPTVIENYDNNANSNRYGVIFHGAKESAVGKEIDICLFLENKSRLGKS